jgi:tRNA pseudouridine38-40 synthase
VGLTAGPGTTPSPDGPPDGPPEGPSLEPGAPQAADRTGLRTLRLELSFDGTDFEGWQRQPDARTVQGEVERALAAVLGTPHTVIGCGRTDAGVHARHHVASTRTAHAMRASELARALDAVLPEDIGVRAVRDAPPAFHAQRDAAWKWYRYRILVSARKRPLERRTVWRLPRLPALEALQAAAGPLQGRHDFRSFANLGSTPGHTVRTLHAVDWRQEDGAACLDVVGDGFLYKMVRTIVGTLREAARGPDPEAAVRAIRDARDRRAAGTVAPARGLCLEAVAIRGERPPAWIPGFLLERVDSGVHSTERGSS